MDSSSSVSNDISKNSKKRTIYEESSNLDVVEISPLVYWRSKSKTLKMKVANQEIIDIDKIDIPSDMEANVPRFFGHVEAGNAQSASGVSNVVATSSGEADGFLSGSHMHNASDTFSDINAYGSNVDNNDILNNFEKFKIFNIVEDPSDHFYFVITKTSANQPSKSWSKRIQEEWKILENNLPDTILVRAYESRMDLLRAVIVGAHGTPYHDGLFFFDVYFPDSYPYEPPHVHYHSNGHKINPNLNSDGTLCLSLLNTFSGSPEESWIPGTSTILQVLVSIQALILNANPYFNEAGFSVFRGIPDREMDSQVYNEETFLKSTQTMVLTLQKQPMHFEDFVMGHFFKRAGDILAACKAYSEGAQVGCLVPGGIQDVDEGDKSCSLNFREKLPSYIFWLVEAFTEIGVKGCEQFVPPEDSKITVWGWPWDSWP